MAPSEFTRARSELGRLTHKHGADDPLTLDARRRMQEAFVLDKMTALLATLSSVSPELRARMDAAITDRELATA